VDRFSRQPAVIAQVREDLVKSAALPEEQLPTYGDVAALYGGIARGVAPVLNSIARDSEIAGEPDLSALVVDSATGRPGSFEGHPVEAGSDAERRWRQELAKIRAHSWSWA
jgi:hypothetical protein